MKKTYKRIFIGIGAGILVLSLLFYSMAPLSVAGFHLVPGTFRDKITEEGVLAPLQQWNLYAPAGLLVEEVYFQSGDKVNQGDLILRLDDTMLQRQLNAEQNATTIQLTALRGELRSLTEQKQQYSKEMIEDTLEGAQAQIDSLRAQLEFAQDNLENMEILYEAEAETRHNYQQAELTVTELEKALREVTIAADLQKNQMEISYSHYEALEKSLQEQIGVLERTSGDGTNLYSAQVAHQRNQTRLRAPVAGKVLFVDVKAGEMADPAKPIAAVYREGATIAEVYLLATDAVLVQPGMEATVVVKGREKEYFPAKVTSVSSYAQERMSELGLAESRVKVTLSLADNTPLILGQKVDVEFTLETKDNTVAVPKSAVFEYQNGYAVLTAEQNKARIRVIEKEFEADTMTVIKSGLAPGDVVLLSPKQEGLREGVRVRVR